MPSQETEKIAISASRRTDLVAFFPQVLADALQKEEIAGTGPSGHPFHIDLSPVNVHTIVLWSKNFANLISDRFGLRRLLEKYGRPYLHFTITGLGGSFIEKGVPPPGEVLDQLKSLIEITGSPGRISVRFDPILYWKEGAETRTNLHFFEEMAPVLSRFSIKDVRFSFAQWYNKAKKRAANAGWNYLDPPTGQKLELARSLLETARRWNLAIHVCGQDFVTAVEGIGLSSCIDGRLLQTLHPENAPLSLRKDKSQRKECRCTESRDIGSYSFACPHQCLYCYANPRISYRP
ncbi:MAG: DUF1848 family protein [Candidatus Aminicenantes bacterium]|nr:DUF1848 family protein [Candidatus Aminicenantes bacterium]